MILKGVWSYGCGGCGSDERGVTEGGVANCKALLASTCTCTMYVARLCSDVSYCVKFQFLLLLVIELKNVRSWLQSCKVIVSYDKLVSAVTPPPDPEAHDAASAEGRRGKDHRPQGGDHHRGGLSGSRDWPSNTVLSHSCALRGALALLAYPRRASGRA